MPARSCSATRSRTSSRRSSSSSLDVDVGFYLGDDDVAGSKTLAARSRQDDRPRSRRSPPASPRATARPTSRSSCTRATTSTPRSSRACPARRRRSGAYYTVLIKRPEARGFAGTLKAVTQTDLAFGNFPWILVGGAFLLALAGGIGFMWIESDRPLRRLAADAVRLAKSETERLSEDEHGGKFGSIARSVNIHIDKLGRDAKSARTNLDQLLGPAPEGSLGTIDLLAGALPAVAPGRSSACRAAAAVGLRVRRARAPDAASDRVPARRRRRPATPRAAASPAPPPPRAPTPAPRRRPTPSAAASPRRRHPRRPRRATSALRRRSVLQAGLRPVPLGEAELQRADGRPHVREVQREARSQPRRPDGEDRLPARSASPSTSRTARPRSRRRRSRTRNTERPMSSLRGPFAARPGPRVPRKRENAKTEREPHSSTAVALIASVRLLRNRTSAQLAKAGPSRDAQRP